MLTESLESALCAAGRGKRPSRFLVVDDSNEPDHASRNRDTVGVASERWDMPVHYCGNLEKRKLGDEIAQNTDLFSGEDRTVLSDRIRFACEESKTEAFVSSPGRNRNAALISAAGGTMISLDDDALSLFSVLRDDVRHVRGASGGSSLSDALIATCVADPDEMDTLLSETALDVFGEMTRVLDGERVPVAMTGIRGNRWYDRPSHFFRISDPMREYCYFPRKRYMQCRLGPFAFLQTRDLVFSPEQFLVTCCHGVDANVMLPPFPPAGHADDSIFGILVRYCYPGSMTAYLPCCVHHVLGPSRPVTEEGIRDTTLSFAAVTRVLLRYLIGTTNPPDSTAADRLIHLGGKLIEIASISHADWIDFTHELYIAYATAEADVMNDLLDQYHDQPSWWARDVEEHGERLIEQSADPHNAIPRELRQARLGSETATGFHREFCRKYGELMISWPIIWRAAGVRNAALQDIRTTGSPR